MSRGALAGAQHGAAANHGELSQRVLFPYDMPELDTWPFTDEDAAKVMAPVLNVVGANTEILGDFFARHPIPRYAIV